MTPASRVSVKNIVAAAVLVLVSAGLTLVAAEAVLRTTSPVGFFIWKPHTSRTFVPSPGTMPGVSGPSRFSTDAQGLRADPATSREGLRILALGGSTTECLYLDQSEAWPRLLQDQLASHPASPGVWVGNAGMSGRNSRHHVLAMRHLPLQDMRIDTVLLLSGINDLSLFLSQAAAYDPELLRRPEAVDRLTAETFLGLHRGDPAAPWFRRTMLWQLLRGLKTRWAGTAAVRGAQDDAGAVYDEWRRHRQQAATVLRELPDLGPGLSEYERNLREVAALAREKSVRLVLMTQPTLWRPGLPADLDRLLWFGGVGDFQVRPGQPYYAVDVLADAMDRYNRVMLDVCATEKLDCIDLSGLPKDTSVFYDDVHFNEAGSRRVASLVADALMARPPFAVR